MTADGNDVVINLSGHGGGSIRLKNFNIDDMEAADFVFSPEPSVEAVANAVGPSIDDGGQSSGNTSDWNMHGYDDDPDGDGLAPDAYVGTLDDGM